MKVLLIEMSFISLAIFSGVQAADLIQVEIKTACDGIDNGYECAATKEKILLKRFTHKAVRKGSPHDNNSKITFILSSGKTTTLTHEKDEPFLSPFWTNYVEGHFLVTELCHECPGSSKLINERTGEILNLEDVPGFSPSHKKFIVSTPAFYDGQECDPPQRKIEIFGISLDGIEREFSYQARDWQPGYREWTDDNTVRFTKHFLVHHPDQVECMESSATFRFLNKKWELDK